MPRKIAVAIVGNQHAAVVAAVGDDVDADALHGHREVGLQTAWTEGKAKRIREVARNVVDPSLACPNDSFEPSAVANDGSIDSIIGKPEMASVNVTFGYLLVSDVPSGGKSSGSDVHGGRTTEHGRAGLPNRSSRLQIWTVISSGVEIIKPSLVSGIPSPMNSG